MQTQARVALNDVYLDEVDESIILQSIEESAPNMTRNAMNIGGGIGMIATDFSRRYLDISVEFAINTIDDMELRASVISKVNEWAKNGGTLTVNYRPKQRLNVVCTTLPGTGYVREWTNTYSVVLRALIVPYWEQNEENLMRITSSNGQVRFSLDGTETAPLYFTGTNRSSQTLNSMKLKLGNQVMRFTGLGLATGDRIVVDEVNGVQRIRKIAANNTESDLMSRRTAESVDDILLNPGENTIELTTDRQCEFTLRARGRCI